MNPYPPIYVLRTRHEHLVSFHSLMFSSELTRELLFFIFAGSYCHNCGLCMLQFQVRNTRSLAADYRDPFRFIMVYGIFLSLNISFIIGTDIPFRHWKSQSLAGQYFLYGCLLSLVCSKVRHRSRHNHCDIHLNTSHVVFWFFYKI